MATLTQAQGYVTDVRKWFSDKKGNLKTGNQVYQATPMKRNVKAVSDAITIQTFELGRGNSGSWAELGALLVHTDTRSGNCAYMSALACFYAKQKKDKIWMLDSEGDHQFCIIADAEPSICQIKGWEATAGVYAVDAWANIACDLRGYAERFGLEMKSWSDAGMRIRTWGFRARTATIVAQQDTNPFDPTYMTPILETAVRLRKGWEF